MNILTLARSARLLLFFVPILLPLPVGAQPVLSVNPTSVSVQTNAGTNAPSQTVQVSNAGNRALKWSVVCCTYNQPNWQLSVSPTRGTNTSTLVLTFTTSTLAVGQYQTSFVVQSETGSAITVNVQVTIAGTSEPPPPPPPPPTGGLTDPQGNVWTFGPQGETLRNGIHFAGGYGTEYRLCNNIVHVLGTGAIWYRVNASGTGWELVGPTFPCDVQPPPPPSTSAIGPQSTITCPAGAVDIWPGVSIQNVVNSYGGNTTFCLRAGTHSLRSSITPKTGNTFVGEYGAVLDGTGWPPSDPKVGAFQALTQEADYVTIRNLIIRNMPHRAIAAYHSPTYSALSDHWTIEYNEIASNGDGVHFVPYSLIRNNYIHHNTWAGYFGDPADNSTLENNEIAYNGREQKVGESANVTFRNNFVHHNVGMGIWYDWDNAGALVEGNRVEDNGNSGIQFEVSMDGIVRNNIVRRNGHMGVYISTSKNVQVYNNTLEHNFRGIQYFINCAAIGGGRIGFDLANVSSYDNTITVGTQSGAWASLLSYSGDCTSTQLALYLNGSKNLTFSHNTYRVPSLANWYWLWGPEIKYWNQWQAIPQDATGTASQYQ
jgi:parallel beta-helix repeat protein